MTMTRRTKQNLDTAMQSEAFTHALYLRFAARARMHKNWKLAQVFQTIADTERTKHFAEGANLAGLVSNDAENLRYALNEKRAQAAMCGRFAIQARADGDVTAAACFEKLRTDENTQADTLEAAFRVESAQCPACLVEA
jgi:rubrerythrin